MSRKDWIQTFSGKKVFPLEMDPATFDLIDQAVALSRICRYGGHVDRHYSVAEHAWRLSVEAERRGYSDVVRKWCLTHDNTEAYLGDVCRPIKHMPEFAKYRSIEKKLSAQLAQWLGLPEVAPPQVAQLDSEVYGFEAPAMKQPMHPEWVVPKLLSEEAFSYGGRPGWDPELARRTYLWRFRVLWGERDALQICPDLHRWA